MLRGLFDFHVGESISDITVDLPGYFSQLKQMGIDTLTFMTKDALGSSYYHTDVGHRNKHLRSDLLREAIDLAHQQDMKLIAYYNASLDDYLDADHPDWRQLDANGESPMVYDYYTVYCMNTPYRDRVRAQLQELAGNYDTDGVWLDVNYIFNGRCYCDCCKAKFKSQFGKEMPVEPTLGSPGKQQLDQFRRDCRREFLADFANAVREIRGESFSIGWNHAGDVNFCQLETDEPASYFSVEFHAPRYQRGLFQTAWMRPFGKKIELMMPECQSGWGEWTVLPQETINTMGALALAVDGELCIGHIPVPSGPDAGLLAPPVADRFAELARWIKPRAEMCDGATSLPTAAVVLPVTEQHLWLSRTGFSDGIADQVQGAHRLLTEAHHHVDIVNEFTADALHQYEVILVPDAHYLPGTMLEKLEAYVMQGGNLIIDGCTQPTDEHDQPLDAFAFWHLTGTQLGSSSGLTARYFHELAAPLRNGVADMPILVRSDRPLANIEVDDGCDVLATFIDPEYEAQPRRHVYHQHAHPAVATGMPAVTVRLLGKGKVAHIAAPVSAAYMTHGDPSLRNIVHNLIDMMLPEPTVKLSAPPSVRMTLMQKGDQLLVHLLHWHIDHTQGSAHVEQPLPVHGLELSITGEVAGPVVQLDDATTELPVSVANGRTTIPFGPLKTHAIIAVNR